MKNIIKTNTSISSLTCFGQTAPLHAFIISDRFNYIQLYNMRNLDATKTERIAI